MLPHQASTSMVIYFVEMARTRGGTASPVAPPRVYTNPVGVKVRKVHGGYIYQPPSLKVSSYLVLDKYQIAGWIVHEVDLYEGVQKFLDHLLDQVEDKFNGPGSCRYLLTKRLTEFV